MSDNALSHYLKGLSLSACTSILREILDEPAYQFLLTQLKNGDATLDIRNLIYLKLGGNLFLNKRYRNLVIDSLSEEAIITIIERLIPVGADETLRESIRKRHPYELLKHYTEHGSIDDEAIFKLFDLPLSLLPKEAASYNISGTKRLAGGYSLRPYQLKCCQDIWALKKRGEKRALLHLPTGAGKTRTAINFVAEFLRENPEKLVIWLANTVELCDQASNEFEKAWPLLGNSKVSRYAYYGGSNLSLSGLNPGLLVAGLQRLNRALNSNKTELLLHLRELKEKVGLVVFDEAHMAIAPTYRDIVDTLTQEESSPEHNETFVLGLSATPGRRIKKEDELKDEENAKLSEFFHHNKINMQVRGYSSPLEYLQDEGYLAMPHYEILDYERPSDLQTTFSEMVHGDNSYSKFYKLLSADDNRNQAIIKAIVTEISAAKKRDSESFIQIIVFACTVDHARKLELLLALMGISCRSIDGQTESSERSRIIEAYRNGEIQVLLNYSVLTAGFDAPNTSIALITRPTNSLVQYVQMAGRAMRGPKSGGSAECKIYTVNDEIPEFQNMFKAFNYWDENWQQTAADPSP